MHLITTITGIPCIGPLTFKTTLKLRVGQAYISSVQILSTYQYISILISTVSLLSRAIFPYNCPGCPSCLANLNIDRTELLTNVNLSLLLTLIGCDDYDEELNKNIFKFVHHFIDSSGRLQCFVTQVVMVYILYMLFGISFLGISV